jgi:hypothetical protein
MFFINTSYIKELLTSDYLDRRMGIKSATFKDFLTEAVVVIKKYEPEISNPVLQGKYPSATENAIMNELEEIMNEIKEKQARITKSYWLLIQRLPWVKNERVKLEQLRKEIKKLISELSNYNRDPITYPDYQDRRKKIKDNLLNL